MFLPDRGGALIPHIIELTTKFDEVLSQFEELALSLPRIREVLFNTLSGLSASVTEAQKHEMSLLVEENLQFMTSSLKHIVESSIRNFLEVSSRIIGGFTLEKIKNTLNTFISKFCPSFGSDDQVQITEREIRPKKLNRNVFSQEIEQKRRKRKASSEDIEQSISKTTL